MYIFLGFFVSPRKRQPNRVKAFVKLDVSCLFRYFRYFSTELWLESFLFTQRNGKIFRGGNCLNVKYYFDLK